MTMKLNNIINIGKTHNEVKLLHAKRCPIYFIRNYLLKEKYALYPWQEEFIKKLTSLTEEE